MSWNFFKVPLYFHGRKRSYFIQNIILCNCRYAAVVLWLSLLQNFMWRCGVVLAYYYFMQKSFNSGSAQVQVLLVACRRFAIKKAYRLSSVNHTTKLIHHHQVKGVLFLVLLAKNSNINNNNTILTITLLLQLQIENVWLWKKRNLW